MKKGTRREIDRLVDAHSVGLIDDEALRKALAQAYEIEATVQGRRELVSIAEQAGLARKEGEA